MPDRFDLTDKVAVITGGGGLLGREHAAALAEVGATAILTDINGPSAEQAARELGADYGDRIIPMIMDVTDPESIREINDSIHRDHGGVQVLVNNAAIDPKVGANRDIEESSRLENISLEEWKSQLAVGLTGAFLCSQIFGSAMAQAGGGVILNIASDLSVIAPDQRLYRKEDLPEDQQPVKPVTYSVIKSGLVGLTRYLATYWADQGVRVNALSPGGVYTDQPREFVQRLTNLIPLGRMAARDEYRGAVQFLCSDASKYMTGQNVVMDGGRSVW